MVLFELPAWPCRSPCDGLAHDDDEGADMEIEAVRSLGWGGSGASGALPVRFALRA